MRITKDTIAAIQQERQRRGLNQAQLAELLGLDKSTVSKILSGSVATMRPKIVDAFNDRLGLDLHPVRVDGGAVSPVALELSKLAESDETVAKLLRLLLLLVRPDNGPCMPDIPTAKLEKVGAALTRIVHLWEEGESPHYAKIGAESLDWIREFYRREFP